MRLHITAPALLLGALAVACTPARRPVAGPLVTDRPDFTESALTVPRGYHQLEFGQTLTREQNVSSLSIGEGLLRSGVTDFLELRLTAGSFAIDLTSPDRTSGFEDANIGAKIAFVEAGGESRRWQPALAAIVGTSVPIGQTPFMSRTAVPEAKLLMAWELSDRVGFASNLNWSYDAEPRRHNEWAGSASVAFSVTDRIGLYTEYFAFAEREPAWSHRRYINGGMTVLLTPSLQFDARAGVGPSTTSRDGFAGLGLSRRW